MNSTELLAGFFAIVGIALFGILGKFWLGVGVWLLVVSAATLASESIRSHIDKKFLKDDNKNS